MIFWPLKPFPLEKMPEPSHKKCAWSMRRSLQPPIFYRTDAFASNPCSPFFWNSKTAVDLEDASLPTIAFSLILIPGQSTPFDFINSNASLVSYAPSINPSSMAPRYLVWVNLNRKFSVSPCLCSEPLFSDPTTKTQRNRGYILCRTSLTRFSEEPKRARFHFIPTWRSGYSWLSVLPM